ncbi:MAG TPA: hypothetical protein VNN80_02115, partial [Polyangiaceae bacterium]|nr:hypothetical protein [Polyangiaceae bacterium]
ATPLVATLTAERASAAALSTTAPGSALSASRRPSSRRWSLPFGAAAALALVVGVGYSYLATGRGSAPAAVERAAALRPGSAAWATRLDARAPSAGASFGGAPPEHADPAPPPTNVDPEPATADPAQPPTGLSASGGHSGQPPAASARSRSAQATTTGAARRVASPAHARPAVGRSVVAAPAASARPKRPPQTPAEVPPSDRLDAFDTP